LLVEVDFTLYLPQVHALSILMGCTAMLEGQLVINPGTRFVQEQSRQNQSIYAPKPEDQPHEDPRSVGANPICIPPAVW